MSIFCRLRSCTLYFSGLMIILFFGLLLFLLTGKAGSFLALNVYHPFLLNVFFINYTFLGDGIFSVCLIAAVLFYFKKRKEGLALLWSFLISGIAVQIIKNCIDAPRPHLFFEPGQYLFFIDGVTLANHHSFPSGHTTSAFAIATVLVMMADNRNRQLLILMLATLVGYSRIYLAQHFLPDVLIGAVLGTLSAIPAVYLATNFKLSKFSIGKSKRRQATGNYPSPSTIQPA